MDARLDGARLGREEGGDGAPPSPAPLRTSAEMPRRCSVSNRGETAVMDSRLDGAKLGGSAGSLDSVSARNFRASRISACASGGDSPERGLIPGPADVEFTSSKLFRASRISASKSDGDFPEGDILPGSPARLGVSAIGRFHSIL